jgi:hypothetical protein
MASAGARRAMHMLLLVVLAIAGPASGLAAAVGDTTPPASGAASTCPASNPPNELTLVSGTPQTAQLDSAFAAVLQVALANTNGCPVTTAAAGVPITFSAPAGGASGTFSASGSNSVTVGSDASGMASVGAFSANGTVGSYAMDASSGYGSVAFSLSNTATGIPARIRVLAPATQSARVATRYRRPLEVRVLDANGSAVEGLSVTFALGAAAGGSGAGGAGGVGSGGSTGAGATFADGSAQAIERTNASGVARSPWFTANAVVGRFTATATTAVSSVGGTSGATLDAATISLDNLAGKAVAVTALGRVRRSAPAGRRYGAPLRVEVRGPDGKPLQGATVTFTLGSSAGGSSASGTGSSGAGASFSGGASQATATTSASGIATSPRLAANTTAGGFVATASVVGSTRVAAFLLRNVAGPPRTVAAGAAASESTTAGARFPIRLAVTVSDADGNPVAGVVVTFAAPAGGASGRFGRARTIGVRTNAAGIAVAPAFTANGDAGGYVVEATVGHATPCAFALVNLAPGAQP